MSKTRITVTIDPETERLILELANLFGVSVSGYVGQTFERWRPVYEKVIEKARNNRAEAEKISAELLEIALKQL